MTVRFTEEEREYIIKDLGNWRIKDDCPEKMRKKIEEKLRLLSSFYEQTQRGRIPKGGGNG